LDSIYDFRSDYGLIYQFYGGGNSLVFISYMNSSIPASPIQEYAGQQR